MHSSLCLLSLAAAAVRAQSVDYTQYVQMFLGTEGGGNMFPGVTRPYGVVKLGPDLYTGVDAYSGYLPTGNVTGFSMTHESGTGGAPKYGVVSQMPVLGNISNPLADLSSPRASADTASVGYYKTVLSSGITTELAASEHAAIYQYTFTGGSASNIVVDVSHVLPSFRGQGLSQAYISGNMSVFSDGHYETGGIYNNGWNRSPNWEIYSCGRFGTKPTSSKVFSGTNTTLSSYGTSTSASGSNRVGAVFQFPSGANVVSRVGISFISTAQACSHLDAEISSTLTLSSLVSSTASLWNSDVLSKITTPATGTTSLQLLYTMLYGMHLIPSNKTGENPLWNSGEPYYDDSFTLWDLHRCSTSLWQVLQPTMYEEYIRSLIDIWRNEGYLPDARSSFWNGRTQGGSNADNVLADAYVKGVRGQVNWADGYSAMVKDASVTPANTVPPDPQAPDSSTKEGRGALPDWLRYGYITPAFSRAVSRAVEYSVNDFAISQVAGGLGKGADRAMYLERGRNWRHHWNHNATSLGFSGFLVPVSVDGSFIAQDPLSCGGCYWGDAYYEGLPWEYSNSMLHDVATLVQYSGGATNFAKRLDTMFQGGLNKGTGSAQFNYTIFNPGNEPDFLTPYLYNFAGRQDLSVMRSRKVAKTYYADTNAGLPGNSDAGAMQTWLLWNMIGLYPMVGQTTFLIHAPWFGMTIQLGGGKELVITTTGGDGTGDTGYYVQSLRVNGRPWRKSWLVWTDVFANGGTMDFVLGAQPNNAWFDGPVPPSPGR